MHPPIDDKPLLHPQLETHRMPGHWLLARLGKRVLRPGGRELTDALLRALAVGEADEVVELAPGAGVTARQLLAARPCGYVGVDRDEEAIANLESWLPKPRARARLGSAHDTGLEGGCATVVVGEAMLTMNSDAMKRRIIGEAYRLLAPGGRYGIHELSLRPDDLPGELRERIAHDLAKSIHVGAQPLPGTEWRALLEDAGFQVEAVYTSPMHLLELGRFVRDEGLRGTLRFLWRLGQDPAALARVREMREVFRRHAAHMGAIALVARKPATAEGQGHA